MSALITREGLERLDAALAWIDANPEQHDQESWIYRPGRNCGTTCCLAGAVVQLAGGEPVWPARTDWLEDLSETTEVVRYKGQDRSVPVLAQELLGVAEEEAEQLFYDATTVEDLRDVRNRLAASLDGDS